MISTRTRLVTHPARADDVSRYRPHPERPPDCAHPHRSRSSSFPATSSVTRTISVQSARWFTHGGWFSSRVQQCPVELAVARPCRSAALAATRGTRHRPVPDGRRPHPTGMSRDPHAAHPGSNVPRAAVPAGVVSVTVRSLQPSSQGCPAESCPSAGRLITRVLRASRSQPVMSVLRSAGPRAPGRVCPVRLRPGPPSRGALALGIQRRKRGNRGRFCRSSCWSCRSSCDWFYTFAPTTADTPPLAHIRSPQVPVAGLAQPVLQPPEPSHPIPFGAHRSLRNPAVQPSMGSHPNSTIQRPQLTCHHRPADFP